MKALLLFVTIAALLLSANLADAAPVYNDLWDISQGYVTGVQASSVLKGWASDPRDIFGTAYSPIETGNFMFGGYGDNAGSWPRGTIHSVYWQTNTPLTIGSFNLFASGSLTQRSFDHFNLAYLNKSTNSWVTLYDSDVTIPYTGLVISAPTDVVVPADSFRAQFRQYSVEMWASGPRVIELDGFAPVATPEPASLALVGVGLVGLLLRRRKV